VIVPLTSTEGAAPPRSGIQAEAQQTLAPGALLLYPCALDPASDPDDCLPAGVMRRLHGTRHFVVENCRSARRWLARCKWPHPLAQAQMIDWNEHHDEQADVLAAYTAQVLAWLRSGNDVGLLSEAGVPAVADPGSHLVAQVHEAGLQVVPLVGPSSLLMALMASGLNGQRFEFAGYLPAKTEGRQAALRSLETRCRRDGISAVWIETPYRNDAMLATALDCLQHDTLLSVACALGSPMQRIRRLTVQGWKAEHWRPGKSPAVFVMGYPGKREAKAWSGETSPRGLEAQRKRASRASNS